jgi:hypothetical protein
MSVGTVTTLTYGTGAYITNTGTSTNGIFNFGIPAGPPGVSSSDTSFDGAGKVFWYDQFDKLVGAAPTMQPSSIAYGIIIRQNPGAVGDSMQLSFSAPSGTYDIRIIGTAAPSSGITQWNVNGIDHGAPVDYYTPSNTYTENYISSIVFPTSGIQTLKHTVTGKNASSSNYQIWLCKFIIKKI